MAPAGESLETTDATMRALVSLSAGPDQPARAWKARTQPMARNPACTAPLARACPSLRSMPTAESTAKPTPLSPPAAAATSSSCQPMADGRATRSLTKRWIRRLMQHGIEEDGNQASVERAIRLREQTLTRPTHGEGRTVRSIGGERVVHVRDGYDARTHGNGVADEPIGIAAAIMTLVMVADDESAVGEELERRHDLGAGERVASHDAPLVVREWSGLAQDALGHRDLAEIMEKPCVSDGHRLAAPAARGEGEAARESSHAIRVSSRVLVLGLERVGEAEQALEDRALQPTVRLLEVDRVGERLLIGSPELVVGAGDLRLARPRHLIQVAQVAGVGQRLRQRYVGRHDRVSGTRASTRARSARGENGLVRYSSAPASRPRMRSASWVAAVSITMGVCAKASSRRSWRQTSRPVSFGICTSRRIRSGLSRRATRSASAPSEASTTRTSASSRVKRTRSRMGGSSSTMRIVVMPTLIAKDMPERIDLQNNQMRGTPGSRCLASEAIGAASCPAERAGASGYDSCDSTRRRVRARARASRARLKSISSVSPSGLLPWSRISARWRARSALARSISSGRSAFSARTITRSAVTSANPPATARWCSSWPVR